MIDAILFAVRDNIINGGFKYDLQCCDVRDSGKPPPNCGDYYLAVHQGKAVSDLLNCLNEYFGYTLTLTMRLRGIPIDRVGNQLLARKIADKSGFNRRCNTLASFLHMDWGVLQDCNTNLQSMMPDVPVIYGFSEPAHYADTTLPQLVGSEWFDAEPDDPQVALVADINFEGCRRGPQAIASYS